MYFDLTNAGTYSKRRTNEQFPRHLKIEMGNDIISGLFGWWVAKSDLADPRCRTGNQMREREREREREKTSF
jgi:hypothetical protein